MSGRRLFRIPALLPLLLLSGCGHPFSTLAPGGPASDRLAGLGWFVYILFGAVAVIMWALIAWIALRRRGSFEEHAPVDMGGGQRWIVIGGFAIPAAILLLVFVVGLDAMSAFPLEGGLSRNHPADILVTSHQWWWQVQYVKGPLSNRIISADEIHIPAGQPVDIDLATSDVIHSFFVPTLHGKVDTIPGQINRIRIQAARPGVYPGRCAEYCGAQHAHMQFLVIAQTPAEYRTWMAHEIQDAEPPATLQQQQGQQVFLQTACALCHTIRGTLAQGRVGPDLTHIGGRRSLASDTFPNNTATMEAWITHAQSLKPLAVMPDVTQYTGDQLLALVAYLEHLK